MLSAKTGKISAVEIGHMPSAKTGQMSAVETGQMSAAETGQMPAVETRQMSTVEASLCLVLIGVRDLVARGYFIPGGASRRGCGSGAGVPCRTLSDPVGGRGLRG